MAQHCHQLLSWGFRLVSAFGNPSPSRAIQGGNPVMDVFGAQSSRAAPGQWSEESNCQRAQCCAWGVWSSPLPHSAEPQVNIPILKGLLSLLPLQKQDWHLATQTWTKSEELWSFSVSKIWICSKTENQSSPHTHTVLVLLACLHNTFINHFLFSKLCLTNHSNWIPASEITSSER